MAKKCPKNFSKIFQQKTLAETWFSREKSVTKQHDKGESDDNMVDNNQSTSDSDIVASSQDTTESKLRKKINQASPRRSTRISNSSSESINRSVSRKSISKPRQKMPKLSPNKLRTPNSTPKKINPNTSPKVSDKKLSISDVCEVNSTVIKEEIDELLQNVNEFDSIEMMHDLSGLIADEEMLLNGLECPSIITCEANTQSTDEGEGQVEQDPLYIDEKEKNGDLMEKENRKRNKSITIKKGGKKLKRKIYDEKEELTEKILMTLGELHVKLQHIVPPQHKIENCAGSRPLTEKQILLFETYGPLKRGLFTKNEDEIIKKNWTNFCELHDWNVKWVDPFLNMRHEGKYYISNLEERKNFVRFLSNGLPWRSLYSVYFRFKNLYNNAVGNGPYSAAEDKKIIAHISKATPSRVNKKCAELARTLNRKRHSIWQRYQKLKVMYNLKSIKSDDSYESDLDSEADKISKNKKKNISHQIKTLHDDERFKKVYKQVKWSYPLVSRFIEKLMEIMSCEDLEQLKNQAISDEIWKKMEKNISVDHKVLQNFWNLQLHMQLFCPKPLYLNDLKMDLIEYLHKNKTSAYDIEWDEVRLNFNGITSTFLSKVFDHLVKYAKTKLDTTDLKISEIIEFLYEKHIPELEERTSDAVLNKLHFKDGRIIGVTRATEKRPSNGTIDNPLSDEENENS